MFRILSLFAILAVAAAAASCEPCTCGVARGARVVGGRAATPGEFPWLVAVFRDGLFICGGTIVARDQILTAAHCINGAETSRLHVLIGEYHLTNSTSEAFHIQSIVQHPEFNSFSYDNDIAVLRLTEPVPDHLFRPVCLPEIEDEVHVGVNAIVSGWGRTIEKGTGSDVPRKVIVKIWEQEKCMTAGYGRRKVTPRMMCANGPNKDSCSGDSGGPLILPRPYAMQIGIVSWGRGCARTGYPGVYTRLTRFLPWIRQALRHSCACSHPYF